MDFTPQLFANQVIPKFYNTGTAGGGDVAKAVANIPYGGIGSYVIALTTVALNAGATIGGSGLLRDTNNPAGLNLSFGLNTNLYGSISNASSLGLGGTWRALTNNVANSVNLFVRIA